MTSTSATPSITTDGALGDVIVKLSQRLLDAIYRRQISKSTKCLTRLHDERTQLLAKGKYRAAAQVEAQIDFEFGALGRLFNQVTLEE
jgi:hypothetical protein